MSATAITNRIETSTPAVAEPPAPRRKRILLVEGDGFTRLVLLLRLRLSGFSVDFTSNGILGLKKLRACRPDILLLDLKLYGLSGLDLIKAARNEPTFAKRPIYVYTHAERMSRATRKEVSRLATRILDKDTMTREDVVQTFVATYSIRPFEQPLEPPEAEMPEESREMSLPGAIEEIVAGVREQSDLLGKCRESDARVSSGGELRSRVSSLADCATVAGLPDLARQAKALQKYLSQLGHKKKGYTDSALATVSRAVAMMSRMSLKPGLDKDRPSRLRTVLVDAMPQSQEAAQQALLAAGLEPLCFDDPARARQHLASNPAEVIIVNLLVPESHGLALPNIRRLPLHAHTPVLFGPGINEIMPPPPGDPSKPAAARLDRDSLLVTELVLKAIIEVQSIAAPKAPAAAAIPAPAVNPVAVISPAPAASLPFEDRIELFAPPPGHPEVAPLHSPVEPPFVPAASFDQSLKWSTEKLGAQPGPETPDHQAEIIEPMPVNSIDQTQLDERPLEVFPSSALQPEPQQQLEAEPSPAGQETIAPPADAPVGANDQNFPTANTASEPQQNDAAPAQPWPEATPNYGEVMSNQIEAAPADWAQQNDTAQQLEALAEHQRTVARCAELEQEVASLREAFDQVNGSLGHEQEAAADASRRLAELEQRLSLSVAELDQQKAELQRADAEWQQRLEAAHTASRQNEEARRQAEVRCAQLEEDLKGLRQTREELATKLAQELDGAAASFQPGADDLAGDQVRHGVAALAKVTAELAKERGERQRAEQRAAELGARLQALHDDLRRTLEAERQDLARITALEEQQRQNAQTIEQRTAALE